MCSVADCSKKELEPELTCWKLDKEQQLADEPSKCSNWSRGISVPTRSVCWGTSVSALVDTGSHCIL